MQIHPHHEHFSFLPTLSEAWAQASFHHSNLFWISHFNVLQYLPMPSLLYHSSQSSSGFCYLLLSQRVLFRGSTRTSLSLYFEYEFQPFHSPLVNFISVDVDSCPLGVCMKSQYKYICMNCQHNNVFTKTQLNNIFIRTQQCVYQDSTQQCGYQDSTQQYVYQDSTQQYVY